MNLDPDVLRELGVELLVVFGSQARGSARADSDLDVGVMFCWEAGPSLRRLDELAQALQAGDRLDLVCLNDGGALLLNEVALEGTPRFEIRPGTFERFRLRAFKRYMDTARFRRFQAERLRALYG